MSARHIDRWLEGHAPPWVTGYTVRLSNGFTEPLAAVHVRPARSMHDSSLIVIAPLAAGATVAVPVGTKTDLGFYEIAAYDTQGHMIARLPQAGGGITPVEAASALPFRPNDHTDDWTLTSANLLDMTADYQVTLLNQTADTWEEVTLFFTNTFNGTIGLASSPVAPREHVMFNLGPAAAMDGYVFSIWVDGLRAYLAPGALQYPTKGLMTARRAAETKAELHIHSDTWAIGDES